MAEDTYSLPSNQYKRFLSLYFIPLYKWLIVLVLMQNAGESAASNKSILVIDSYHIEHPWVESYMAGIYEVLGSKYIIKNFQMDTKRLPSSEIQKRADAAYSYYQKVKPDLVILGDDNAIRTLTTRISDSTPVIYLGLNTNPRVINIAWGPNVTGVLERPLFKRSISEMNSIMNGKISNILILFDSGVTSKAVVQENFRGRTSLTIAGVNTDLKLIGNINEWYDVVLNAQAQGYQAIVIGLYHTIVDASGAHVPDSEVIKWTSNNTPVPLFAFWDFAVGKGKAVGGLVLFGKSQGQVAAKLAISILENRSDHNRMPTTAQQGRYYFSQSELERWQLTLPEHIRGKVDMTE